jgi:hypothetical protein
MLARPSFVATLAKKNPGLAHFLHRLSGSS